VKHVSLFAAAAVVLVANGFALVQAARNRFGNPDAEVVLTNRELSYLKDPDDSGVTLILRWQYDAKSPIWRDPQMLRSLGFDYSVPVSDSRADEFYGRQLPRTAFVALEYDGPAWRSWQEAYPKGTDLSRLMAIDAAPDPAQLRARHPDRHSIIVVPAVIRISFIRGFPVPDRVAGAIEQLPTAIHVSKPVSDEFRNLPPKATKNYRVYVTYGRLFEPWVTGVEFGPR
jgi:hypothetical protein